MSHHKILGLSEVEPRVPVGVEVADARQGLYLVGPTGGGKSTLLAQLVLQDIETGRGCVLVDPKGDTVDAVVERMPAHRISDVVLIDPRESAVPSLNVLDSEDATPDVVADFVVAAFASLFASSWGPRTEDILRSAILTVTAQPTSSLADVAAILGEARLRRQWVPAVLDSDALRSFWEWFEALTPAAQGSVTGPLNNKLRALFLRPFAAKVLGSARSSFSMADVLDGGILLVRLPKGAIGGRWGHRLSRPATTPVRQPKNSSGGAWPPSRPVPRCSIKSGSTGSSPR